MKKRTIPLLLAIGLSTVASFAIILEDLTCEERHNLLADKKVGIYIGSFDPIHKGHESNALTPLNEGLIDYCIIYPVWGGDTYKNRTPVSSRLAMLSSLYKSHPTIIISKLPPGDFQALLTKDSDVLIAGKPSVETAIKGTQYIGILGSDAAIKTAQDEKKLSVFMRGVKIPVKYWEHSAGTVIALPAESFIVILRNNDSIAHLNNKLDDRPIIATITTDFPHVSSTAIRTKIKNNEDISDFVSPPVLEVIEALSLYKDTPLCTLPIQ